MFHERLKTTLQVTGTRPGKLAELTGIDKTNVSHLLSGQREPSFETLAKLLKALPGVDARWLVIGHKEPT
jgi:transcriptional regulator with XRE-family HTH domain